LPWGAAACPPGTATYSWPAWPVRPTRTFHHRPAAAAVTAEDAPPLEQFGGVWFVRSFPDMTVVISRQDMSRLAEYTSGVPILGIGMRPWRGREEEAGWCNHSRCTSVSTFVPLCPSRNFPLACMGSSARSFRSATSTKSISVRVLDSESSIDACSNTIGYPPDRIVAGHTTRRRPWSNPGAHAFQRADQPTADPGCPDAADDIERASADRVDCSVCFDKGDVCVAHLC